MDDYAGTYALTDEITLEIVVADSGLQMVRAPAPPAPLRALTETIFVRAGRRGFYLFERDERGAVVRLVHWRDNNPVVWRRRWALQGFISRNPAKWDWSNQVKE
ncbi:MAG TPA: hypothetical protein VFR37_14640 [Longimicrobium sp.]|nr:hypothetical protein [Longimicrobium sp.]